MKTIIAKQLAIGTIYRVKGGTWKRVQSLRLVGRRVLIGYAYKVTDGHFGPRWMTQRILPIEGLDIMKRVEVETD